MRFEERLERTIFASRWLLAPFFIGLLVAILVLLLKFFKELVSLILGLWTAPEYEAITSILTLVDTTLIASLLLIIIFSGYENFVSKLNIGTHEDRPAWMGKVSFSDLKLKLIGAIVAISAVELLKGFLASTQFTDEQLGWKIGIHLTFVISGVLFAVTDRIAEGGRKPAAPANKE
ncbi:MAG: TIGR00645 family protein [Rhodospirillaceae bacterium]